MRNCDAQCRKRGDRSVALDESRVLDVAQPFPDGDVLADAADGPPVHEVRGLVDGDPGDQVAVGRSLDGRGDGEVEAAGRRRGREQQHAVAEAHLVSGVERVRTAQAVGVGVEERRDLGGALAQEVRRREVELGVERRAAVLVARRRQREAVHDTEVHRVDAVLVHGLDVRVDRDRGHEHLGPAVHVQVRHVEGRLGAGGVVPREHEAEALDRRVRTEPHRVVRIAGVLGADAVAVG